MKSIKWETTLIVFPDQQYELKNTSWKHVKETASAPFGILMTHTIP